MTALVTPARARSASRRVAEAKGGALPHPLAKGAEPGSE